MKLDSIISLYELRLEQQTELIGKLQELVNSPHVTRKVNDELTLQLGERDVLFYTLDYLKKAKDLIIDAVNRDVKRIRENE